MKFVALILTMLVCLVAHNAHACPVALQQHIVAAPVVQSHCAVQLQAAPIVQQYVVPETAAVVVQPQVQHYVAPLVAQQVVVKQAVVAQQHRQFRTPLRDAIRNRQNVRAQRQAVRAVKQQVVVAPLVVAPY